VGCRPQQGKSNLLLFAFLGAHVGNPALLLFLRGPVNDEKDFTQRHSRGKRDHAPIRIHNVRGSFFAKSARSSILSVNRYGNPEVYPLATPSGFERFPGSYSYGWLHFQADGSVHFFRLDGNFLLHSVDGALKMPARILNLFEGLFAIPENEDLVRISLRTPESKHVVLGHSAPR